MQDHDYRHEDRDNVDETCCCVTQRKNIEQGVIIFRPRSSGKMKESEKELAWLEE